MMHARSSGGIISTATLAAVTLAISASLFFSSPAQAGAIHDAARAGDAAQVEQLIATGTAVDKRDRAKKTALHWAAETGHLGTAQLLIAEGAEVNVKDFTDQTPLHSAAYGGHEAVAELLLANDAEANALDKQGISPLDRPINKGFAGIVKMLTDAGGKCGTDPYESETCKRLLGEE